MMKYDDLRTGMFVYTDLGFDCMEAGYKKVEENSHGEFYVNCEKGKHFLDGCTNMNADLIGVSRFDPLADQESINTGMSTTSFTVITSSVAVVLFFAISLILLGK